ncbi:MAG: hypothetical protein WAU34_04210, partial [Desulfobacterales bacterium]
VLATAFRCQWLSSASGADRLCFSSGEDTCVCSFLKGLNLHEMASYWIGKPNDAQAPPDWIQIQLVKGLDGRSL